MTDELLPYYNRELAYIRQLAGEFAAAYPDVAGHLRLSAEQIDDPHVGRLIEGFAYINARTRRKLDDEFPELAEAILGVLYPHYLTPVPSTAIVRFRLKASQAEQVVPYTIPRGSLVETQPVDGQACRFRTAYDVRLVPLEVRQATYRGAPIRSARRPFRVGMPILPASHAGNLVVERAGGTTAIAAPAVLSPWSMANLECALRVARQSCPGCGCGALPTR